jgi:hypothetical protein
MSEVPKFAQKRPSIHFKLLPQLMQLPRHERNFWRSSKLPWLESKEWETDTDEQRFKHVLGPTESSRGNLEYQIACLVQLLEPHRAKESRTHKDVSRVLSLDPCNSQLLQRDVSSGRRREPPIDSCLEYWTLEGLAFGLFPALDVMTLLEPIARVKSCEGRPCPRSNPTQQRVRPFESREMEGDE